MAKDKEPPVVVEQQTLAEAAKCVSEPQDFVAGDIVIAACKNGHPAPTQPVQVVLELSPDDVIWSRATSGHFSNTDGATSLVTFALANFAQTGAWRHYRLSFGSHVGAPVTIAASTGQAPIFKEEEEKPDPKKTKGHEPDKGPAGHDPHGMKR